MNRTHRTDDWKYLLVGIVLVCLGGPLLLVAYAIQYWAAAAYKTPVRRRWDWKDRWASVRAVAFFSRFFYLLLILLFILPLITLQHTVILAFLHIPTLRLSLLWPPSSDTLWKLWLLAQPLAPALALVLEHDTPKSHPQQLIRVQLPGEVPPPPQPPPPPAPKPKPKRRSTTSRTKKASSSTPDPESSTTARQDDAIPPARPGQTSLWGQIDWNTVPDNNPLKQQALEADQEQKERQTRFVQPPEEGKPHAAATAPSPTTPPPPPKKRIDFTQVDE